MRTPRLAVLALLLAAAAAPASAQLITPAAPPSLPDPLVTVQQEQLRQQLIDQQNQTQALQAQLRAEQGVQEAQRLRVAPRLPPVDVTPGRALPHIDTSQLASIPDAALADSNKKVLDAAGNRR
jgi:Spy/CpxP family protein refolding chaperone